MIENDHDVKNGVGEGAQVDLTLTPTWDRINKMFARGFSTASMIVVDVLAIIALAAIAVSTWGVARELWAAIQSGDTSSMAHVITSALTVFIFIEVLAVSIRYLQVHHIEVKDLIDVTLAIIFREIWVALFNHALSSTLIFALSALIIVLGVVRWLVAGAPAPRRGK